MRDYIFIYFLLLTFYYCSTLILCISDLTISNPASNSGKQIGLALVVVHYLPLLNHAIPSKPMV